MVAEDDALSNEKEINKLMALISLSFKKIYKPNNNNLRTSSNTSREHQDNTPRINRGTRYDNQRVVNVAGARENVALSQGVDDYECKQDGKLGSIELLKQSLLGGMKTDDEPADQELEAPYHVMATRFNEVLLQMLC
ncbi:hypothetical protein Tco_0778571 [Tanacetum coccineum]